MIKRFRRCVELGRFRFSDHANEQSDFYEDDIDRADVAHIVRRGWYNSSKDKWDDENNMMNRAICGPTIDGRDARIVVALDEDINGDYFLVITVIDLEK